MTDTLFCSKCGTQLLSGSAFCGSCGAGTQANATAPAQPVYVIAQPAPKSKTKTPAVLLAVFLSYWSWLYTFRVNKLKFFIGLGGSIIVSALLIINQVIITNWANAWTTCMLASLESGQDYDCVARYPVPGTSWLMWVGYLLALAIYVWAIVDNARRSQEWYAKYPNTK